ncbi:MAG: hypothetical protein ACM31C_02885 [Acidobacteriota bacterium]
MKRNRHPRPPRNPVSLPLAGLAIATLFVGVLAMAFDGQPVMRWAVRSLLLACALAAIAYTVQALRLGWIATIGGAGQVYHYRRADEPVLYWVLVVLYLALSLPTAWYLAGEMV